MRIRALILMTAVTIGCGESLEPLAGELAVLKSIAGTPLPAPYVQNDGDSKIVADTMAFDGRLMKGVRRTTYEDAGERYSHESTFTYTRSGNTLAVTFMCPPNAMCIAGPHLTGTLNDLEITFDYALGGPVPFVFRRVLPDV